MTWRSNIVAFGLIAGVLTTPVLAGVTTPAIVVPAEETPSRILVKYAGQGKVVALTPQSVSEQEQLLADLAANERVEYVEIEAEYRAAFTPNDSLLHFQQYIHQIEAPDAWSITAGSSQVTIAVLDTGVDIDNPDLRGNIWINEDEIAGNGLDDDKNGFIDDRNGWDFVDSDNTLEPNIDSYTEVGVHHGTVIAGIASARGGNGQGVAGVTWRSRIMPVRILKSNGIGKALDVASGIDYAVANGADIINLSFVGDKESKTLARSIENAYKQGVLVVAAAGNEVLDGISVDAQPRYPLCNDGPGSENWVIGVASVDKNDRKASFSNYGHNCIDVSAPGVGIFSTLYHAPQYPEFKEVYGGFWSGTSFSTAMVSATLALVKSLKPEASAAELRNILTHNTDDIDDTNKPWAGMLGSGRINVKNTVYAAFGIGGNIPKTVGTRDAALITTYPETNNGTLEVKVLSSAGDVEESLELHSMGDGISVTRTDTNKDGNPDYIVSAGSLQIPWVKILDEKGKTEALWQAYAPQFGGGVVSTVGDLDGDGEHEIVTGPKSLGGAHIKVFSTSGKLENQWFAFNRLWKGGVHLATGDINNDGVDEIIVGVGQGSTPLVKIFTKDGKLLSQFMAFHANFLGGVRVSAADIDLDGKDDIVVAAGPGGGPHVRVFNQSGEVLGQFFAYDQGFRGGVYVASGDINRDGRVEIITGGGTGTEQNIRIFNYQSLLLDELPGSSSGMQVRIDKPL